MLDTGQLGIVAGTRNLKTALEFVRFATTAESMAAVSGYIAYSPARRSSLPLLGTHVEAGVDMNPHMPTYPDNTVRVLVDSTTEGSLASLPKSFKPTRFARSWATRRHRVGSSLQSKSGLGSGHRR